MEEDQKSFQELKSKWAQIEGEHLPPPPIPPKPNVFSVSNSNSHTVAIPITERKEDSTEISEDIDIKSSVSPPKYDPFSESSEEYDDEEDEEEEEEGLIQQVQKAHLQYTKLEESRSPTVHHHAQIIHDKNSKKPPPPPPPSRKYHASVRSVPNQNNQVPVPPPVPIQPPPIMTDNNKDSSPPLLPPRPLMPQLPPRPSQSTLARAHTIVSKQPLAADPEPLPLTEQRRSSLKRANTSTAKRAMSRSEFFMTRSVYPDFSQASRNPPFLFEQDNKIFSTSHKGSLGALVATRKMIITGTHALKTWDIHTGMPLTTLADSTLTHSKETNTSENSDKVRAIVFSPSRLATEEGLKIWVARQESGLSVVDVFTGQVLGKRHDVHQAPISFMLRYRNSEIWSVDESGILNVWDLSHSTENLLLKAIARQYLVTSHAVACTIYGQKVWMSTGRTLASHVISNSSQETLPPIRIPNDLGNITKLITIPFHPGMIFASHDDGKISVWDVETIERVQVITVSLYGICTMACVGEYHVWAGYNTGMIYVYDTRPERWSVVKVWKAHTGAVTQLVVDESELLWDESRGRLQVLSSDSNGYIGLWDGLLTEQWKETQMLSRSTEFCTYDEARIMISSWNIDANKPEKLTKEDDNEVRKWLGGMENPDVIVVGIQEIVDLESKKQTARSLFFKKKVEETEEVLTHRYKLWHDYLVRIIGENYGSHAYTVIKTDQMVGLFSCIFVRASDAKHRVRSIESNCVKTGLKVMNKSIHGNKGGIAIRFVFDHSSLCFVNCHLAAGQSHVQQRNADAEGILQTATFQPNAFFHDSDAQKRNVDTEGIMQTTTSQPNVFCHGGDGSLITDHEFCFLSGDLNYRIKMNRNDVLRLLTNKDKEEAWEKLRQEDQLLKQRTNNPLFKLLNFEEAPIQFDPTYKYDPGTDFYDRSEKKRIPAWCDRVLFKGRNVENLYYRRYEAKASDHRPIAAGFSIQTKVIDSNRKDVLSQKIDLEWAEHRQRFVRDKKARYIADYERCSLNDAFKLLESTGWDVESAVEKVLAF